jgi:hypothetical protein
MSEQKEPIGTVLLVDEELKIVTEINDDGVPIVQDLGDRRMSPDEVPEVGDDCPNPVCDGIVEDWDRLGKRFCSEGCLEWLTCFKVDGQDCDKYAVHDCNGTIVHEDVQDVHYRYHCTECNRRGAGVKRWREAWWPNQEEGAVEAYQNQTDQDNPEAEA